MNMVGIATDLEGLTFKFITDASEVSVKFFFDRRLNKMLPVLGTEDDVDVIMCE